MLILSIFGCTRHSLNKFILCSHLHKYSRRRKQHCGSVPAFCGSVAKRCGHSLYTILNILSFDFSVLFVGYSLIGNISLMFFVAQRTKRPAREKNQSLGSLFTSPKGEPSVEPPLPCLSFSHLQGAAGLPQLVALRHLTHGQTFLALSPANARINTMILTVPVPFLRITIAGDNSLHKGLREGA